MVPKIPCGVCTEPIPKSSRRCGAPGCGACAAFFARSVQYHKTYICKGTNECLKTPSILAKGCQRCRFDKCLEIGMTANGMPENTPSPTSTPEKPIVDPEKEKNSIFSMIIDAVLSTTRLSPNLVVSYLESDNQDLISTSLETIKGLPLIPLPTRANYLRTIFNIFPISQAEFPVLLKLSICKTTFKWLSVENQLRISTLQHHNFLNLNKMGLSDHRILELTVLSQSLLNIFYAYN